MLMGEEAFVVEMDTQGKVWYEICAVSKPGNVLSQLAYPLARILQRRFAVDSTKAMKKELLSRGGPSE